MRTGLTLVVFVLDVWSIVSILGSRASRKSKWLWTLGVTVLPLAGFAVWLLAGPKATSVPVGTHE